MEVELNNHNVLQVTLELDDEALVPLLRTRSGFRSDHELHADFLVETTAAVNSRSLASWVFSSGNSM